MKILAQIKKHLPVAILAGVILLILLAILVRHLVWLASAWHPFENIELSEAVQYYSPSYLYTFTEEELVFIEDELRNVVAYGEENPKSVVVDGHLQSVAKKGYYRLTTATGEVITVDIVITDTGCWVTINGVSYKGKRKTLEPLNNLLLAKSSQYFNSAAQENTQDP